MTKALLKSRSALVRRLPPSKVSRPTPKSAALLTPSAPPLTVISPLKAEFFAERLRTPPPDFIKSEVGAADPTIAPTKSAVAPDTTASVPP